MLHLQVTICEDCQVIVKDQPERKGKMARCRAVLIIQVTGSLEVSQRETLPSPSDGCGEHEKVQRFFNLPISAPREFPIQFIDRYHHYAASSELLRHRTSPTDQAH